MLSVNFMLDATYKHFIVNSAIDGRKDRQFDNFRDSLKYLLMGDSYMQGSVNPLVFDSSFNYASSNENFAQSYYKLKNIVEIRKRKPACIILPVDISSFSSFRTDRFRYDPYWIRYIDYFELAKVKNDRDYIYKWISAIFFSYAGNYDMIFKYFNLLLHGNREPIILGYLPRFDNFNNVKDKQKAAAERADLYLKGFNPWDKDMVWFFRKILEYCTATDIKVILVRLPVTEEYQTEAAKLNPPGPFYRKIDSIVWQYPVVLHEYDFQSYLSGHPEYFRNPDHINNRGAPVFSAMLNEEFNGKY